MQLENAEICPRQGILTKGDNNLVDDVILYPAGQLLVHREEVMGLVKGSLPWLGWLAIGLQDLCFKGLEQALCF